MGTISDGEAARGEFLPRSARSAHLYNVVTPADEHLQLASNSKP